ncbi:hypothetical protein L873DRAFT_1844018 [Choiromyces venosus 120613-1]|uniref:Protein kinase domain-containing protein n=1 Tax=Choiromyces venosus 120613-1 TaxID=1336337 RepID=A0A3N4JKB1_9PEZI|nr:hypothetical protein L873DRAFT_1844018 [Choiromyces venosus 120613-1]
MDEEIPQVQISEMRSSEMKICDLKELLTRPNLHTSVSFIILLALLHMLLRRLLCIIRLRHPRMQPTTFHPTHILTLRPPEKAFRSLDRKTLDIDSRYQHVRPLATGCEGEARLYKDLHSGDLVVIKTFFWTTRQMVIPESLDINPPSAPSKWWLGPFVGSGKSTWSKHKWGKWPVEIPATLLYSRGEVEKERYITALDYFFLEGGQFRGGGWRLVTPFFERGTVEDLAGLIRHLDMRPEVLDELFRGRFAGCHDDVKPDNIFLSRQNSWVLSDLGNLRHFSHPYHSQKPFRSDPRLADTHRALKSYMTFLREASGCRRWFDSEFYRKRTPWSRLYWDWCGDMVPAEEFNVAGLADEWRTEEVEGKVEVMREEMKAWTEGMGQRPRWWRGGSNGCIGSGDSKKGGGGESVRSVEERSERAELAIERMIDVELCCVSVRCMRLLEMMILK